MKTPNRLDFIRSMSRENPKQQDQQNFNPQTSKEDRLRQISLSKVSNIVEFEDIFQKAIKKQKEERLKKDKEFQATRPRAEVIEDSLFDDIDKELGF